MLPTHTETLILPFGAKISNIECEVQNIETIDLSKKIYPAPQRIILDAIVSSSESIMDEEIYNSNELFPENWFNYDVSVGLDENNEHKTLANI